MRWVRDDVRPYGAWGEREREKGRMRGECLFMCLCNVVTHACGIKRNVPIAQRWYAIFDSPLIQNFEANSKLKLHGSVTRTILHCSCHRIRKRVAWCPLLAPSDTWGAFMQPSLLYYWICVTSIISRSLTTSSFHKLSPKTTHSSEREDEIGAPLVPSNGKRRTANDMQVKKFFHF